MTMTNKPNKSQQNKKERSTQNLLESLKDLSSSSFDSIKKDVIRPEEFIEQILGLPPRKKNYTGEITPGESVEMSDVFTGKRAENIKEKEQITFERRLLEEERYQIEKKSNELRIELHTIMQELSLLAKSTNKLTEEIQIASLQAPVEPGVYHIIFFEKLMEFIRSFRKKIEDASIWLHSTNKRAEKKNYWTTYKKKGSSFLLSPDHYLQRSAG